MQSPSSPSGNRIATSPLVPPGGGEGSQSSKRPRLDREAEPAGEGAPDEVEDESGARDGAGVDVRLQRPADAGPLSAREEAFLAFVQANVSVVVQPPMSEKALRELAEHAHHAGYQKGKDRGVLQADTVSVLQEEGEELSDWLDDHEQSAAGDGA